MRNAVAGRPNQWPVLAEGSDAQLIGTVGQGFDRCSKSQGDSVSDRLVLQVATRKVLAQNRNVHEGIGDKFPI
jgi:hypothetical protein